MRGRLAPLVVALALCVPACVSPTSRASDPAATSDAAATSAATTTAATPAAAATASTPITLGDLIDRVPPPAEAEPPTPDPFAAYLAADPPITDTIRPSTEPLVILLHQDSDSMAWVEDGAITARYQVSWGQVRGAKQRRGDNKTPRGAYFVINKHRGEFEGPAGPWYGGHWIKINYPGPDDAARGLANGWITESQAADIRAAWARRAPTNQSTTLGGGIGLHGWIDEWQDHETRLRSWGCVVLHNRDIRALFDDIPVGTLVVLLD